MGIMVYCFLWVMQDLYHQPYHPEALLHPVYTLPTIPCLAQTLSPKPVVPLSPPSTPSLNSLGGP